ncbi:26S proteasome non-ATPase regulatory subunit 7 [Sciurus carolinensis]|nr:26S proteasome non-ATPase regulatory subunit 7 [Sciurus carolinensis]
MVEQSTEQVTFLAALWCETMKADRQLLPKGVPGDSAGILREALWERKKAARRLPNRKGRSWAWRVRGCFYRCRCLRIEGSRAWRAGCVTMPELAVQKVVVHPLVLLSVVDHFNRIGKVGNQKRVVGVLLGSWQKKVLDVSNSFAVPFDEDDKDDSVWFLDHDYLENMYGMFKKVNARERIVGWYHTGPKLHKNDIAINELMKRYCPNSVLVIIDVKPKDLGLPTEAYISVEEVHDDGTPTSKTFEHVTSEIGAEEAEEVGVEHLLRDIKDTTVGTLSQRITNQVHGLKGLNSKLLDIRSYLEKVATGKLPINHQIIYQLQDVFNLLPDVSLQEFVKAFYLKTNDQMVVVYLASLIRSVVALHNLINNKIANRDAEKKEGQEKEESKKDRKDDKEKDKDKEKSDVKKEEKKEKK